MKVYISADIEGVTGVTNWDETELNKPQHAAALEQMTAEVCAACEGALSAGASEIWVKDAHDSGRNLIAAKLPPEARLIRAWSGHPYMMLQELDATFDCVVMTGYHSRAGAGANPLSHTMTGALSGVWINERPTSEFLINSYTAASLKVPVAFVSGDQGLCDEIAEFAPGIRTVAVKTGVGSSTISIQPALAASRIRAGVAQAVQGIATVEPITLPSHFKVDIAYKDHFRAFRCAFYPGASLTSPTTLHFESDNYFDVLRLFLFVL